VWREAVTNPVGNQQHLGFKHAARGLRKLTGDEVTGIEECDPHTSTIAAAKR
jgi:hypothetical protein